MSLMIEGIRVRTSHVLDKVSPTRALFGNIRGIRIRELPTGLVKKMLHPKEPSAITVRRADRHTSSIF